MTDDAKPTTGPSSDSANIRDKVADTVSSARETVSNAAASATTQVQAVTQRAAQAVDGNPLAIVAGGLAAGVLAGLLLPRSERETELLQPLGARIGQGFSSALQAAREAGKNELDGMGINADAARDVGRKLFDSAVKAATSAGQAAAQAGSESIKSA